VIDSGWHVSQKDSFRFYWLRPEKDVEVFFTTRNHSDNDEDHNLGLKEQAHALSLNTQLVVMKQSHSTRIVRVDRPGEIEADGCFTTETGLALSVRVADCVPVFFWGEGSTLTGVAHAGWRGTLAKIALRFTEIAERELGLESHRLRYALGPSIGQCCYRVGKEILREFSQTWPNARDFFKKRREGLFLDLRAANRFLLNAAGAKEGNSLDLCTSCERSRFYSHRVEPGRGRNWGIITRKGGTS